MSKIFPMKMKVDEGEKFDLELLVYRNLASGNVQRVKICLADLPDKISL